MSEFRKVVGMEHSSSKAPVEVAITSDGLRVCFMIGKTPVLQAGDAELTPWLIF